MGFGNNILAALSIRLTTDASKLTDGLKSVKGPMDVMKKGFTQLGGLLAGSFGVGLTAVSAFKGMISATGDAQDKFAKLQIQCKEATHQFYRVLSSGDLTNFIGRLREAVNAAGDYVDAIDRLEDFNRSLSVQEAEQRSALAKLRIDYQDVTKSYEERAEAAKKYIQIESELSEKRKTYANQNLNSLLDELSTLTKVDRERIKGFVREYENYDELIQKGQELQRLQKAWGAAWGRGERNEIAKQVVQLKKDYPELESIMTQFGELTEQELDQVKDALIRLAEADASYYENTIKAKTKLHSLLQQIAKDYNKVNNEFGAANPLYIPDVAEKIDMPTASDLLIDEELPNELEAYYNECVAKTTKFADDWRAQMDRIAEYNQIIEQGVEDMAINFAQSLGEVMVSGGKFDLASALLNPIADMIATLGKLLITTGIGVEAFKKSLQTLQGPVAIAAGIALVALAAAIKSSIQNIPSGGGGTVSMPSSGTSTDSTVYGVRHIGESTQVIRFEGFVQGDGLRLVSVRNDQNFNMRT